jgi:hypothetical protein
MKSEVNSATHINNIYSHKNPLKIYSSLSFVFYFTLIVFDDIEKCILTSEIENREESLQQSLYKNDFLRNCNVATLHHQFGSMEIVCFLQHDMLYKRIKCES